jgi:hypothetical protein
VVDPSFDLVAGLPAASGHNTAILNGSLELTTPNAVVAQAALPELGRCVKVVGEKQGKHIIFHGRYIDAGCVESTPAANGKFEWMPGAGALKKFKGLSGASTLETVGKEKLVCTSNSQGEYTAPNGDANITLTGCNRGEQRSLPKRRSRLVVNSRAGAERPARLRRARRHHEGTELVVPWVGI